MLIPGSVPFPSQSSKNDHPSYRRPFASPTDRTLSCVSCTVPSLLHLSAAVPALALPCPEKALAQVIGAAHSVSEGSVNSQQERFPYV